MLSLRKNSLIIIGLLLFLVLTFSIPSLARYYPTTANDKSSNLMDYSYEGWAFKFNNYAIKHQGEAILDIEVSYKYKQGIGESKSMIYPDFLPIYKFIDNFLTKYPNETDYWEIVNKKLVKSLLTKSIPTPHGINYKLADLLDSLTVRIDVRENSSNLNMPRSTIITGKPHSHLKLKGDD